MLNLSEAAKVLGQPKSAIWRAVNSGRLPAARTFAGDYRIDPAELHRVFPAGAELATDVSPIVSLKRDPTELERAEAASMQEQIERLFEVGRCPSADDLRLIRRFEKGGSGSSGLEFKRPAADAASGGLRWLYA